MRRRLVTISLQGENMPGLSSWRVEWASGKSLLFPLNPKPLHLQTTEAFWYPQFSSLYAEASFCHPMTSFDKP
jgi:hypothetical protein